MFKIVKNPTFTHDVTIMVPVDGGHDKQVLSTTFRVVPTPEAAEYDLGTPDGTTAFLKAAIVRFNDVADDKGEEMPHSDALRDELLGFHFIRNGLVNAYLRAVMKAQVGN